MANPSDRAERARLAFHMAMVESKAPGLHPPQIPGLTFVPWRSNTDSVSSWFAKRDGVKIRAQARAGYNGRANCYDISVYPAFHTTGLASGFCRSWDEAWWRVVESVTKLTASSDALKELFAELSSS